MESLSPEPLRSAILKPGVGFLLALLAIGLLVYRHFTATFGHFRDLGVPYIEPTIFVGNGGSLLLAKESAFEFMIRMYNHFKGSPMGGIFEGRHPSLMLRDPELIKAVLIKDFESFNAKQDYNINSKIIQLNKVLISLKGQEWKNVRTILNPAFSIAKLRAMEPMVQHCCVKMKEFLKQRAAGDTEMEMKLFTSRYTLDVIGICAFGVDCESLKYPEAEFVRLAEKFMDISLFDRTIFLSVFLLCPSFTKYIPVTMFNTETIIYLCDVVQKTMSYRAAHPSQRREDFIQILVDISQQKDITGKEVLSDLVLQAQGLIFFMAGFETSSTLLSFATIILAHNPEIQDRLRKGILDAEQEEQDLTCYELVNKIPLLEQVLMETLRLYPPIHRMDRTCTKRYKLPNTNVTLEVGDVVNIPVSGIMRDPEYYPDPEVFNPDRFSPNEKNTRQSERFLAFGLGPRYCIGMRFAMFTTKIYLFYLLKHFKLRPSDKTQFPIAIDKQNILLKPMNGLWIHIEPLEE